MMLSGSLSSISKRLRNFIIRFTILLYYGELFDIPATKFCTRGTVGFSGRGEVLIFFKPIFVGLLYIPN